MNRTTLLLSLWWAPTLFGADVIPSAASKPVDDAVRLSDFNVTADDDRGYAASETLSGSRVATKIIDLPYTVNVLTSEFFADFAIFDLNDTLTQIGSFTGLSGGGGFTLRGSLPPRSSAMASTGSAVSGPVTSIGSRSSKAPMPRSTAARPPAA